RVDHPPLSHTHRENEEGRQKRQREQQRKERRRDGPPALPNAPPLPSSLDHECRERDQQDSEDREPQLIREVPLRGVEPHVERLVRYLLHPLPADDERVQGGTSLFGVTYP